MATSRMVGQIGRVVGGRYRLLAPLGTGASADVFVADDVTLRRRVAVKVLHAALAGDDSFLRRFRAEARMVAALRHPNIMAVYDWGEEDDGPYLVLEFLGGGSLRDLLDRGFRLSPSQALLVGLEAARALDYAHRRGLVHRDVKPANLLFDDEGRLCIADFGIARALAEATWTEPSGAVVGTVRYASPEQARGNSIDGRADVYALTLVLCEAVTGKVPFSADTTIATLMARLDGPIPIPSDLGPLGQALQGAAALDPTDRVDAATLVSALDRAARRLPRPEPLPLSPLPAVDLTTAPADPTALGIVNGASSPTTVVPSPGTLTSAVYDALTDPVVIGDLPPVGPVPPPARPAGPPGGLLDDAIALPPPRVRRRWPRRLVVSLLAVAAVAALTYALLYAVTPRYAVPTIDAATVAAPAQHPLSHHFKIAVRHASQDKTKPGDVLGQDPKAGAHRPDGSTITVTVSDGQAFAPVPDLRHLDVTKASAVLAGAGFNPIIGGTPYSAVVPKGQVESWEPQTSIRHGSDVVLTVSAGPEPIPLPDVHNLAYGQAKAQLDGLGLPSTEAMVFDDTVPIGSVVSTSPEPGDVPPGTTITINVSQGPQIVTLPDVTGDTINQAAAALAAVGLQVGQRFGPSKATRVVLTDPLPGSRLNHGAAVDLYVGR
jgi:eukaryotic-like serine/threonine-protein kinase